MIWTGSNDGHVQVTRDGGKTWTNVTRTCRTCPPWGTVDTSNRHGTTPAPRYITVDCHQVNIRDPFVYKTNDYGKTWKLITNASRTRAQLRALHPRGSGRVGLLFLGTENALYVSFDDGENWQPLQNNLPHAPVYWLMIQEHFNDLVLATYGRGVWILDDITPLREMTPRC